MHNEYLVRMANDIAHFFATDPNRDEAVRNVMSHMKRFWDPRMRRQIIAHFRSGGEGLEAIARQAVALLEQETAAKT